MDETMAQKVDILRRYADDISTESFECFVKGDIPSKKVDGAMATFASGMDRASIIGLFDTTLFGSGKEGYVFTDTRVYYKESFDRPGRFWYKDIVEVEITDPSNEEDSSRGLRFLLTNGDTVDWTCGLINKTPLRDFFIDMMGYDREREQARRAQRDAMAAAADQAARELLRSKEQEISAKDIAGFSVGNRGSVNKLHDEAKFDAVQGHGFAAEQANDLFDRLSGRDAKLVGDDFAKDGADRIVDGVSIQSKYCSSGSKCVKECFSDGGKGAFRYFNADGTPMQIEVPSDMYDAAVEAMAERIRRGQVEGVADPAEAKKIIKKGHFTYAAAKNIAKAGTVESLVYDSVNGVVIAGSAFGVTALLTFASSIWSGEDIGSALEHATYAGIRVAGTTFVVSLLSSQLAKAGINSALIGMSDAVIAFMGPKAAAVIVNAFRSGSAIHGAAAMRSASKLLRGNIITGTVTVAVLSTFDIVDMFNSRISGAQLFKNVATTGAAVAGGMGGWAAGAAIGSVVPIVGTLIGGLVGAAIGGSLAGDAANSVVGEFIEDDAEEMVRIIRTELEQLAPDYLINKEEGERITDRLQNIIDADKLKEMYASSDRASFARDMLTDVIEDVIADREYIPLPSEEQMKASLIKVLEDIGDAENDER